MTQEEYIKFHEAICEKARNLSLKKNQDYAAPNTRKNDPYAVFANFMQCERLNICSVNAGFLVRLSDKISRLANVTRDGHKRMVDDERVEDTILDIINYSILQLAYNQVFRNQEEPQRNEMRL